MQTCGLLGAQSFAVTRRFKAPNDSVDVVALLQQDRAQGNNRRYLEPWLVLP